MTAEKPVFIKEEAGNRELVQDLKLLRALGQDNLVQYEQLKAQYGTGVAEDVGVFSGRSREAAKVLAKVATSLVGVDEGDVDINHMGDPSAILISHQAVTADLKKMPGVTTGITVDYSDLDHGNYYISLDRTGGGQYEDITFAFRNDQFAGGKMAKGDSDGQFRYAKSEVNFNPDFSVSRALGDYKGTKGINVEDSIKRIVKLH